MPRKPTNKILILNTIKKLEPISNNKLAKNLNIDLGNLGRYIKVLIKEDKIIQEFNKKKKKREKINIINKNPKRIKSNILIEKEFSKKSDLSPKHFFRIEVLKRDKWTCRKCGKDCNSAHHIFSRIYCQKYAPELEWDLRNGVALCFDCHKAISIDGKKWFEENKYYKRG